MRFTSNVPPTTRIQLKSMMFAPWPNTKELVFEDLRRLPKSWTRLANLEHVPIWNQEKARESPGWNIVVKSFMGRYFVNQSQVMDRSRAPGVWDRMWKQIPLDGETPVREIKTDRKPAGMANRPIATPPRGRRQLAMPKR